MRNSIYKEITEAFKALYEYSEGDYDTLMELVDTCRIIFEYNYYIRAKEDEISEVLKLRDKLIDGLSGEKRKAFLEYGYSKH